MDEKLKQLKQVQAAIEESKETNKRDAVGSREHLPTRRNLDADD
jgi:hypothetical protein